VAGSAGDAAAAVIVFALVGGIAAAEEDVGALGLFLSSPDSVKVLVSLILLKTFNFSEPSFPGFWSSIETIIVEVVGVAFPF